MIYKESELYQAGLEYFKNDILACNVWINKYALKSKEPGYYEEKTPDDTIRRLAKEILRAEEKYENPLTYDEIYETLKGFNHFIFGGSILFGLGNNNAVSSLGNCFFIHNGADSYGGIFNIDESMVQLMKRRGGVGITLENLRPSTSAVNNSAHSSTGAVSFMNRYSSSTREVAQDGRRGALMITMHVNHPDITDFIMSKDDLTKITGANISVKVTDEFMKAVEMDQDYILSWPTDSKQTVLKENIPYNKTVKIENTYVKRVRAREVWNSIVKQAHKNAEPGVLFWDNVINESPSDMYKQFGFQTLGTNPCVTGDTLVAVADGRNAVPIQQLAKEGKDVPVYCLNDKGDIEIQLMRNPRVTGYNQPVYEVKLDSGDSVRVTGNHKLRLKDGSYREAKNLAYGDSLHVSTISYNPIVYKKEVRKSKDYRWIKSGDTVYGKGMSEHRMIYEFFSGKIPEKHVIHHKDHDTLNNDIQNLSMMSKLDHDSFHIKDMLGEKNPYHRMSKEWKRKFSSRAGLSNHTAYQVSNEMIIEKGIELAKTFGRRFTKNEWVEFASKNGIPSFITPYRGFKSIREFAQYVATELGYEHSDKDIRTVKRFKDALKDGYNAKITDDNVLLVERFCEECGNGFWTYYDRREHSFCGLGCSNKYTNRVNGANVQRTVSLNKMHKTNGEKKTQAQLKIYSDLKFELGRDPVVKEWEVACKESGVSSRLGTKYGLTWKEVKDFSECYNHKVVSVELCGHEDVYNGTVDKYHNFFTVLQPFNKNEHTKQFIINQLNCGEVPLSPFDSCRLGSINLFSLVQKPFTPKAKLDWDKLAKVSRLAQRFMDDIVELEEEKVMTIIAKIESDPERIEIKRTELDLWNNVLRVLRMGRRTGVGVLGLGDMLASLGIPYGTPEATHLAGEIQKCIAVNSYRESVKLAKERGAFKVWDADIEAGNPFLTRVIGDNFSNKEYDEYLTHGRRNVATMSIAPTGSLAILSQTTSGIEPVFKVYYRRRRKINPNESSTKVTFIDDNGDSWEEYNVIHYPFIGWFMNNSDAKFSFDEAHDFLKNIPEKDFDELVKLSPWHKAESHDIDYIEKINTQAAIQKWVDHSISVTHNLPENISIEEVDKIYFHGWKSGCKGLTIYREGSRSGVLISKKTEEEDFKETHAPKRPKTLEADYYVASAKGTQFAVIVGKYKGRPYEVFAFENPPLSKNTTGKITKVKKGQYKFVNGEFEIDNLQLASDRIEERTLTLTASMLLRHGAPIDNVVNVIKKIDENITSFSSVVRRHLLKYVDEKVSEGENCHLCGDKLVMQDGCVKCVNPECGYSKCG